MKKLTGLTIAVTMVVLSAAFPVFAENNNVEIAFRVGDSILEINGTYVDVEKPYITSEGTTLVPIRVISEAFGADVEWDGDTKTITVDYNDNNIVLQIDSKTSTVNGSIETLEEAPQLTENGYTMIPLRFISENLGAIVGYDDTAQIITVSKHGFDSTSLFAFVKDSENTPDGKIYNVLIQGEERKIFLDANVRGDENFQNGDIIVFSADQSASVVNIYGIFAKNGILNNAGSFADFRENTVCADFDNLLKKDLSGILSDEYDSVEVIFGVLVDKNGKEITIGDIKSDSAGVYVDCRSDDNTKADIMSYTEIYTYHFNDGEEPLRIASENSIQIPSNVKSAYNNGGRIYLDDEKIENDVIFAIARVLDGEVIGDIYLITAE